MYFLFFSLWACLSTCRCFNENEAKNQNHCDLLKQQLESSLVSVEIIKKGFHREVVTTVLLSPDVLSGLGVLLVHSWPRGVYVDPYQLASLSDRMDWQILLDSAVDLELPAYKTTGFVTYAFPTTDGETPKSLKVTIPIHGRYHEPSAAGETFISIHIKAPELLLRIDTCAQLTGLAPHAVMDAPCSADNSSLCPWVRQQLPQDRGPVGYQVPVGDGSSVGPVCVGTLLVTMLCCLTLSRHMWRHRSI